MKLSPVQLVESNPIKLLVEQNAKYSPIDDGEEYDMQLGHFCRISRMPATLRDDSNAEIGDHNYYVVLGIRSKSENVNCPYKFELITAGRFQLDAEKFDSENGIDDAAAKYGFTMLFGQIRESLLSMTSRMKKGPLLLPTMSFMDTTYEGTEFSSKRPAAGKKSIT